MGAIAQYRAESKDLESLDSARLVLAHALFILFGKALVRILALWIV